eukprot:CAMPEP_0170511292 /NCGR_PEP_ID=MMETSP0208-20121228/66229_1 /TAXON_ID=197538 /ORGANISM="Strombidium inclinatum, Strain S3" /LENGTH=57 /DNA_ID=CAMNT_0010794825 /DNA_START=183 /DNA_END=356 /DNA_ORIENTATION=+
MSTWPFFQLLIRQGQRDHIDVEACYAEVLLAALSFLTLQVERMLLDGSFLAAGACDL